MVVETDPVSNDPARMLQGLEAVAVRTLLLERAMTRSTMPFCSGLYGVMNSYCSP